MSRVRVLCAILLAVASGDVVAQVGVHAVDPTQRYRRLICLVHFKGSGKTDDPVLPEYVPGPSDNTSRTGIIAWSVQPTDDRSMAIIQVVAVNRGAFAAIFADKRPEIRVFEIGKDKKEAIEAEMRKYKKDFSLDAFRVLAQ